MATTTDIHTLQINYLTQAQYDTAVANNTINADELYFTPASGSTVTLNGIATTNASFYAPITGGSSGQFLKSNGTSAPSWDTITIPTIPSNNITGSGTSGKVVKFTGDYTIGDGWGVTDNTTATAVTTSDTNLITGRTLANAGYVKSSGVTSITLTEGTGISVSSSGTAITSTGTRTISLATITKNNTTSTASPAHGGTFTAIDSITYDTYGRVTGVNTKTVTLPTDNNTDTKVTQAYSTTNGGYPLLMTATAGVSSTDSRGATTAILNNNLWYNPDLIALHIGTSQINSLTSTTANTAAYSTLTLGNNVAVSSTTAHSQGRLILYGSTAYAHTIQGAPTAARTITLPDNTGTIALVSDIPIITDEKVKQLAAITTNGAYPLLLGYSTATTEVTNTVNKSSNLTYNPNTKALVTGGTVDGYTLAAASAKGVTDSSSASAISTGTSLPTERDIYYGLPTINGAHNYTSSTNIYAPITVGLSGQFLVSNGSGAPSWALKITASTATPTDSDGTDGDIWFVYEA